MVQFGIVDQYKPGFVRVRFDDLGIVSAWLPICFSSTQDDPESGPLGEGEQVVCLMDKRCEHGAVIGCIYSEGESGDEAPEEASANVWIKSFKDGTKFIYNKSTHEYSITNGTLTFKMNRTSGWEVSKGEESLKKLIDDTLSACTHITVSPSGGPILNVPEFEAIAARLALFFSA